MSHDKAAGFPGSDSREYAGGRNLNAFYDIVSESQSLLSYSIYKKKFTMFNSHLEGGELSSSTS